MRDPEGPGIILSDSITVGQLTFVLRVLVQILSYGGLALIGFLILANTPRLAPISTHDVISRHVGGASTMGASVKWLWSRLRRNSADPYPTTNLFIALFLGVSYAGFVALSDVGFLGFYSCNVPGKDMFDVPASVNTTDAALNLLYRNMLNGSDPSTLTAYRCDSTDKWDAGEGYIYDRCTSWKNGTYGDQSFFNGLNTTDTDVLMPRQLALFHHSRENITALNKYYNGLGTTLNPDIQIYNGMVLDPHAGGLTVVMGVPTILPEFEVNLERAIAVEVDIACMTTGIISMHSVNANGAGIDSFSTQGNWRRFYGPDYMQDVLTKTVDDVREYYKPFFAGFSPDSDGVIYSNDTSQPLSRAAHIESWSLPTANFSLTSAATPILGNCTASLQQKLGITNSSAFSPSSKPGQMCSFLGMGGSLSIDGSLAKGFNRMVCAVATQVNMVHAKIGVAKDHTINMDLTRLPSDLNFIRADLWDEIPASGGNKSTLTVFEAYERYTLSDNPNGQTQHYIRPENLYKLDSTVGAGSAGRAISGLNDAMTDWTSGFGIDSEYRGLGFLPEGYNALNFTLAPNTVSHWIAQVGASELTNSIGFNGWAGKDAVPLRIVSTGGHVGTCYTTPYAFGFLPLLFAACVVVIWCIMMVFSRSLTGTSIVKDAYGGTAPYVSTVCPGAPKDTLLVWEHGAEPRLQVVGKGMPVVGDGSITALQHLKAGSGAYPFSS